MDDIDTSGRAGNDAGRLLIKASRMGAGNHGLYAAATRLRDWVLAAAGLLILSPLIAVCALIAARSSGGSPIFRQVRLGRDGERFRIYKLRTMYPAAPSTVYKKDSEHLVTPVGRVMRELKIDELPQLWNILRGDMSLVGPRPIVPEEYGDSSHTYRLRVRPGLTGLWQLSRVRENRFDENIEYDLFYLANRCFSFDTWLIWRTVLLLLTGRETKIRLAARLWERKTSWRRLVPEREIAIPIRTGMLRSRVWLLTAVIVLGGLFGFGAWQMWKASGDFEAARAAMVEVKDGFARLDGAAAATAIGRAEAAFGSANRKLESLPSKSLAILPVARQNRQVAQALAASGADLTAAAQAGLKLLQGLPQEGGRISPPFKGGRLDAQALLNVSGPALVLKKNIDSASETLAASPQRFLLPVVSRARSEAISQMAEVKSQADAVAGTTLLLPGMFGLGGERTWILGAENNAELRGRGGYLGSFGVLKANNGKLELGDFHTIDYLPQVPPILPEGVDLDPEYAAQYFNLGLTAAWANLLMSPDFPTGARLFLSTFEKVGNIKADGLISLDPVALANLMEVTGPINVPGIPEPLTSQNVVDWSLNRLYLLYQEDNDERRELLSGIAAGVWQKLISAPDLNTPKLAEALGKAIRGRHLVVYSGFSDEQDLLDEVGAAGRIEPTSGDYLLVNTQNVGENKMDYYLRRDISYSGTLGENGDLTAETTVTLTNTLQPGTSVPGYVAGGRSRLDLPPSTARSFLSLFVPERARVSDVSIDGQPTGEFTNSTEKGKRRLATVVELGPGKSQTVKFGYLIPASLEGGRYRLRVQNQATVRPDTLNVQISLPKGSQIEERETFLPGAALGWSGALDGDKELEASVSVSDRRSLLDRITSWLQKPVTGGSP